MLLVKFKIVMLLKVSVLFLTLLFKFHGMYTSVAIYLNFIYLQEPHEKIPMSKPEITRFGPIASQKLKEFFNSFELDYPDDPRGGSFVRHIIPDDMLRKLVTAVKSLSKGIVLAKNILTRKHEMPPVETYVFEVDVVYDGDKFRATRKVKYCIISYSNAK